MLGQSQVRRLAHPPLDYSEPSQRIVSITHDVDAVAKVFSFKSPVEPCDWNRRCRVRGPAAHRNLRGQQFFTVGAVGRIGRESAPVRALHCRGTGCCEDGFSACKGWPSWVYYLRASGRFRNRLRVAVHRLRHRYGQLLRAKVAQTVSNASDLEEEMHYLLELLAADGQESREQRPFGGDSL
jgi:hypothetical protein